MMEVVLMSLADLVRMEMTVSRVGSVDWERMVVLIWLKSGWRFMRRTSMKS